MSGSGAQYMIRPETLGRLSHSLSLNKGIDLALDPSEIQASIMERVAAKPVPSLANIVTPIANAAIQAALANSFQPFKAPIKTIVNQISENPTPHVGYGIRHDHIEAKGRPFLATHPARFSTHNDVGFMQQIPQVYKDAARVASGRGLWL
jgi:hypothetical protein